MNIYHVAGLKQEEDEHFLEVVSLFMLENRGVLLEHEVVNDDI